MIIYSSRFLTRAEVWYDDDPGDTRSVDWILYQQRSRPVLGAKWRYFHNYVIDLTQSPEQLQAQLNEDTAYKIRRARDRDRIVCERCDPSDRGVIDRFQKMYDAFAAARGISPLDRARMDSIAASGALDLSVAKDPQGNILVYHANYRSPERATELYLPSLYRTASGSAVRNLIGRANRYLTWNDILRYKEQGLKRFDFGGWYPGTTDSALLKINDFKRGFGGQVIREYQCERILSRRGWLVLRVAGLLDRIKLIRSGSKPPAAPSPAVESRDPAAASV